MQLLYVLFLEVSVCIDASYVVYISLLSILLKSEHTRMLTSMFYNGFKLSDNILALLGSCCCTKKMLQRQWDLAESGMTCKPVAV